MVWVGRDVKNHVAPKPLPWPSWAGIHFTGPACLKPCPNWLGTLPGMGHAFLLWAMHSSLAFLCLQGEDVQALRQAAMPDSLHCLPTNRRRTLHVPLLPLWEACSLPPCSLQLFATSSFTQIIQLRTWLLQTACVCLGVEQPDIVGKQWEASAASQAGSPFLCRAWWNTGTFDKMDNFHLILWSTNIRLIFSCHVVSQYKSILSWMCGIWAWMCNVKDICVTAL